MNGGHLSLSPVLRLGACIVPMVLEVGDRVVSSHTPISQAALRQRGRQWNAYHFKVLRAKRPCPVGRESGQVRPGCRALKCPRALRDDGSRCALPKGLCCPVLVGEERRVCGWEKRLVFAFLGLFAHWWLVLPSYASPQGVDLLPIKEEC